MEVRPGYKQTEVGVIPEEWDTVRPRQTLVDVSRVASRGLGDSAYCYGRTVFRWMHRVDVY